MGMPDINVQQLPPLVESNVERAAVQEYQSATIQQKNQWDFEKKSKDTIMFIGETWSWSFLMSLLIGGVVWRKYSRVIMRVLFKKV